MALTKEQIYDHLAKESQARFSLQDHQVQPELDFAKETGVDSIDVVELILEVEDEYDLVIPDEELDSLTTLQKVVDYVYVHQA
ncbi:acyl carrier protein [Fructobacillus ficulneus]|uniref:Acyl carrier protein n=1 Tax=Fructobacillus ficulneus TaxID=157463 RepID=A0A0K8MGQ7_9LACO|nr:acyl carrier protein [Fructobacillus ficulneus]GAO99647.1 acyl carrier protein [Fructobacillus ficulneus]